MTRKLIMLLGLAVALSSSPALAAEISNLDGQTCGSSVGTWHFVQNNIPTKPFVWPAGTLTATIGGDLCTDGGQPVGNGQTQHFYCTGFSGELTAASTGNLPGRLQFSHVDCEAKQCDQKVEVCK